jgi:recombinational DNA repair protein (RecF pathway)
MYTINEASAVELFQPIRSDLQILSLCTYFAQVADVLCHRLLRHMDYAWQLAQMMVVSSVAMERYASLRLMFNLLPKHYI